MSNPVTRRLLAPIVVLALAALLGSTLVLLQGRATPAYTLEVSSGILPAFRTAGPGDRVVTAFIDPPAVDNVIIAAEFEGGPNDPDQFPANPISYDRPEAFCVVPVGSNTCDVTLALWGPIAVTETVRFWIGNSEAFIDTLEAAPLVVELFAGGGCALDPDATDVINLTSFGIGTSEPPGAPAPPPGFDSTPSTCENQPSPSPSPTSTATSTASPTATPTASPTPTPPRPPRVVVFPPYAGRIRLEDCRTTPASGDVSWCTAEADAETATGHLTVVAGSRNSGSIPEPVIAEAEALAGVDGSYTEPLSGSLRLKLTYRFRIARASNVTHQVSGSAGSPLGSIELRVFASTGCGSGERTEFVDVPRNAQIENRTVEITLEFTGGSGCASYGTVTARGIVRGLAQTSTIARGSVRVEADVTLLDVTAQ